MTRDELKSALDAEIREWSAKSFEAVVEALREGELNYERSASREQYQVAVTLLASEPICLHVAISVDDGSIRWACVPLTSSFLIRNGQA